MSEKRDFWGLVLEVLSDIADAILGILSGGDD